MILDLYVGSLREFSSPFEPFEGAELQRLTEPGLQPLLVQATAQAFVDAPEVDRQAHQRIVADFSHDGSFLRSNCWLALLEQEPAAACLVSLRRYYCASQAYPYVELVAVNSRWQKSGLGGALLRHTLGSLATGGYRGLVHAHVRRGNHASERLFLSCNFLRWSSERHADTGSGSNGSERLRHEDRAV